MEQLYVIKIGGNVIDDEKKLSSFLADFAKIKERKILIHGGGKMATRIAEQSGIKQQMNEGRRITDAETLKIVTMVYAGDLNKNIVAQLQSKKCNSIGLCGADGNIISGHKRLNTDIDYGFVGDVDQVNAELLNDILAHGLTVVVAPLIHDGAGQLLNTNADTIASKIAVAMSEYYDTALVYSFEKTGVLLDINNEDSLVRVLDKKIYSDLLKQKKIADGMIPKLDNAFSAIQAGVTRVNIGDSSDLKQLITGKAGTTIT